MAHTMTCATAIRPACENDLAAIVGLLSDDVLGRDRETVALPLDARYQIAFEAIQRDPNQLLRVAEADSQIIGCLQITIIPGLLALPFCVARSRACGNFAAAGLGGNMIALAIEECRRCGCKLVQLTTDKRRPAAIRFYQRLGFEASHEAMKLPI